LEKLQDIDLDQLIAERYTRLMGYGKFKE
jgi:hypothetical protein